MSGLSPTTRALLEAARSDGPNATTRAKIWGGVAGSAGITTGAAAAASASAAASAGSATAAGAAAGAGAVGAGKLLAIGALFGSAVTIGVATLALRFGAPAPLGPDPTPRARVAASEDGVSLPSKAPTNAFAAPYKPDPDRAAPSNAGGAQIDDDALTREAMLVAEARGALRRGDASGALSIARSARAIRGAQLEPEELALEAAACRALGREADALSLDLELRRKYPGHALAR